MMPPNKPAAPNPAIALQFQSERQWRGVGEPSRREPPVRGMVFRAAKLCANLVSYSWR